MFNLHKYFPFLPQRKQISKCEKLVRSIEDRKKYVVHISDLKQTLNHGLELKRVHRVIQFNQKAWLKPYIDMNNELTKEAKNNLKRISLN